MLLISVQQTGDVRPAEALVKSLDETTECFLLFHSARLLKLYGEIDCKHSLDVAFCVLNPKAFDLVVSFSGHAIPQALPNLHLIGFFNEVGIPTIEIQHGLYQYGINNADTALQVGSRTGYGDQFGIELSYPASTLVTWGGPNGIGYLKSALTSDRPCPIQGDFVLVTSNLNWHVYTDQDRYKFCISVVRTAMDNPDTHFVWKPHPAELSLSSYILDMARDYKLANLVLETEVPAEILIPHCNFGISTISTTLVDFQHHKCPVVLFRCKALQHLAEDLGSPHSFQNYFELKEHWHSLEVRSREYLVETGIKELDRSRLLEVVRNARSRKALASNWLPISLRYLNWQNALQSEAGNLRASSSKPTQQVAPASDHLLDDIVSRLPAIEKGIAGTVHRIKRVESKVALLPGIDSAVAGTLQRFKRAEGAFASMKTVDRGVAGSLHRIKRIEDTLERMSASIVARGQRIENGVAVRSKQLHEVLVKRTSSSNTEQLLKVALSVLSQSDRTEELLNSIRSTVGVLHRSSISYRLKKATKRLSGDS